jgi:hypothetical protein
MEEECLPLLAFQYCPSVHCDWWTQTVSFKIKKKRLSWMTDGNNDDGDDNDNKRNNWTVNMACFITVNTTYISRITIKF